MKTLVFLNAIFARYWTEKRRYIFNTLSGVAALYLLFFVVFTGARSFLPEGATYGMAVKGMVVIFMLWSLANFVFMEYTWVLTRESQLGTLEQLAMCPFGIGRVLLGRTLAGLSFHLLVMLLFLFLMMATTGRWLHLDLVSLLPLVILTIASVQGLGLAMGGLALIFKQITAVFQILQFGFAVLLSAPIESSSVLKYLPLAMGSSMVRRVMVEEMELVDLPMGDLLFLLVHAVVYFVGGFFVFKILERRARIDGNLGHY